MLKNAFTKGFGVLIGFFLTLQSVFASEFIEAINNGADFGEVVQAIGFLDWITYALLIFVIFTVLDRTLSKSFGGSSKVISAFGAFFSVTGFMYVLVNNGIFPMYFMLFAGELLVIALAILLVVKIKMVAHDTKYEKVAFGIAILLALSLLHLFNGMIVGPGGTIQPYLDDQISNDSLLASIGNLFYFESIEGAGNVWFMIFAVFVVLFSLRGSSADVNLFDTKKWKENNAKKKELLEKRKDMTHQLNELYQALGRARR